MTTSAEEMNGALALAGIFHVACGMDRWGCQAG